MYSFLFTISFLLHIITLFAIFQLLKQQQANQKETDSQDVMEVMEIYLEEIREENNRLEKLLEKQHTYSSDSQEIAIQEINNAEKTEETVEDKETDSVLEQDHEQLDTLLRNSPTDEVNASLESRVLQLHMQGKDVEEIAKQLNCGKTEAELIIKLYRKT